MVPVGHPYVRIRPRTGQNQGAPSWRPFTEIAREHDYAAAGGRFALHQLFEEQVDIRPNALAVVDGDQVLTYAALERRANQFARHLRGAGIGRASRVALLLPRSVDAYAAMLGILKAGAAYVPLDPAYPSERVAYILGDASVASVITNTDLASRCTAFRGSMIQVDADRSQLVRQSGRRLKRRPDERWLRSICYIIYTSGSTGQPKGVMVEHRNALHLVCAEREIYGLYPEDNVYQAASLAFDLSVEEIWIALHAGATLVTAPTVGGRGAGADLVQDLRDRGVTVLSTVPTLLSMLTEDVPSLRLIILGREVCPPELVERWARPGRRLVNTYGPTETTVIATYADLTPGEPVTIGRPVPGYRVYLLDETLGPVRRGDTGEICIGGPGVARGYVGIPEETVARFVPDPFAPADDPEARLYRTGDLGRFREDGALEFHGHADGQVKVRAYRVELSEIESLLLEADGVAADAACAVHDSPAGVQQLPSNGAVDKALLRDYLRSRLPDHMVPASPLNTRLGLLRKTLRPTPHVQLAIKGMDLFAKLEYVNPVGSIKDRAAYWILKRAAERGEICEETTVIESSSGNFASALAGFTRLVGLRFIPVIDPNISPTYESFLRRMCPKVVKVEDRDDTGGFLKTRLEMVQHLCATIPNAYWTNQYENVDAMEAHYELTGGEICAEFDRLDYAFIGVGTAGTIAGVSRRLKERYPGIRVIAVDSEGSVVFGQTPRKRHIPGIGSSIVPPLLSHARIDGVVFVPESETVRACRELLMTHGLFVGGSSGTVFAAIKQYAGKMNGSEHPTVLFLCPDRGTPYLDTVFDPTWATRLD